MDNNQALTLLTALLPNLIQGQALPQQQPQPQVELDVWDEVERLEKAKKKAQKQAVKTLDVASNEQMKELVESVVSGNATELSKLKNKKGGFTHNQAQKDAIAKAKEVHKNGLNTDDGRANILSAIDNAEEFQSFIVGLPRKEDGKSVRTLRFI